MNILWTHIRKLYQHGREQGQGLVEYALILGLVSLAVIAIVELMRPAIEDTFERFANRAPVAPPSLAAYTPPPTNTPIPTIDPNATFTPVPSPTETVASTETAVPTETATQTPTATATPACIGYGPYGVPGRVQMETFACGGSNSAFVDSTGDGGPGSGAYRADVTTEGPDLGTVSGGYYVGWLVPNEWIVYDVTASVSQMYDLSFRAASASGNGRFRIDVLQNNQPLFSSNSIIVPSTGGNQSWSTVSVPQVPLIVGTNQIRIVFESGGFNVDYFDATVAAAQPTATHTPVPSATPTAVPTNPPTATATAPAVQYTLIDADFDNNEDGFSYQDDTFFGTNQGYYARGDHSNNNGYTNDALRIRLGNRDNNQIENMSGGWVETFTLSTASQVNVSFRYRLIMSNKYEYDECSDVLVSVDGQLFGSGNNNYVSHNCGPVDTNWQSFSFQTDQLSAGTHTIIIGGFNNKKTTSNEETTIFIDDVFAETN
jgi:Flp pilus assembly pilin Flp